MALANLGLRFLLELAGVGALGYWGYASGGVGVVRLVAGIAAPFLLIVVWGMLLAPKARSPLTRRQRTLAGTVILEMSAAALMAVGATAIGIAFGAIILLNAAMLFAVPDAAASALRGHSVEA